MPDKARLKTLINFSIIESSLGLFLLAGSAIISLISINRLELSSAWVHHTYETRLKLDEVQLLVKTLESEQRAYLLTKKKAYLTSDYTKAMQRVDEPFQALLQRVHDNQQQYQRVVDCYLVIEKRLRILDDVVKLTKAGRTQEAKLIIDSGVGAQTQEEITARIEQIKKTEETLLGERLQQQSSQFKSLVTYLVFGEVVSFVVVTSLTATLIYKIKVKQQIKT